MIVTFVLNAIYALVSFFVGLLPVSSSLESGFGSALTTMIGQANQWTYLFPVGTLFTVLGIVLVFEGGVLLWRLIKIVINILPSWLTGTVN